MPKVDICIYIYFLIFIYLFCWWECSGGNLSLKPQNDVRKHWLGASGLLEATFSIKTLVLIWQRMWEGNLEECLTGATVPLSNQLELWLPVSCAAEGADCLELEFMCRRGDGWVDWNEVDAEFRLFHFSSVSVYPLFQRSFFFLLCLPSLNLAFHKVQRLHLTLNFSSSIIKKFIFTLTDVSIWLPFLTVGCVGWMDSGSCTHCICSMAALQEPAGKFDVDERGSKEGHPRSRSLSYSGGALQQCHPRWQKQSLQACLNCTGIIRKPNFII